ncbi:hypothetical protein VNO77_00897 [Canavalia gladiata]|uniref:Uncharacterized protein n=1 Tax=Canavalia gladiata TaxID=3824 RepID=A0AAN9R1R9_CANGL
METPQDVRINLHLYPWSFISWSRGSCGEYWAWSIGPDDLVLSSDCRAAFSKGFISKLKTRFYLPAPKSPAFEISACYVNDEYTISRS